MKDHPMKDKNGFEYRDLLAVQKAQLLGTWQGRLNNDLFCAVSDYVVRHNRPALDDKGTHRVLRGYDIVQIIMDWPELRPCYPSPVPAEDIV